jgi:zinc protease
MSCHGLAALLVSWLALQAVAPAQPPVAPPAGQVAAPAPPVAGDVEPDPFAPDPAFVIGALPNGLQFYIRPNRLPERRLIVRLVVRTGSLHEQDAERGYAHFVEHMAFNGTEHFKPGALVKYFEERGARFGAHVNAETGFDETSYFLAIPSDRSDLVDRALQALADFASRISFDGAEVRKERPVIVEEWRLRQGVGSRLLNRQLPLLYNGSRYAERLPIGTLETLERATPDALRRFHETWYRPERMAVIVVGDVERARAEALVKQHVAGLKARGAAPPPPNDDVPLHPETLVDVTADPEATSSLVTILRKRREPPPGMPTYREEVESGLVMQMVSDRLTEITRKPDAPWLSASPSSRSLSAKVGAQGFGVRTKDGQITAGLEAVLGEEERIRQHGFLAAELDRARQRARAGLEHAYRERDKAESGLFVAMCEAHFLSGAPLFAPDRLLALGRRELDRVTLADVNARAREMFRAEHQVVLVSVPQKDGVPIPSEADLRGVIGRASTRTLEPWTEAAVTTRLMETPPPPGRVTSSRVVPELGATVVTFANGVEAWLKPTDFRNEQISFSLQGPGGTARAARDSFPEASLAVGYVRQAGVGGVTASNLSKLLAGKLGSASPFMGLGSHGVAGSATPEFLETALQLLYLAATSPNRDPAALELVKRQMSAALANRDQNPNVVFGERVSTINLSGHYTTAVPTVERIARLDLEAVLDFYKASFADLSGVRFVMVGSFQVEQILPLLEQYVGGLRTAPVERPAAAPFVLEFPPAVVRERVVKGREPASRTVITFHAPATSDLDASARIAAVSGILETRLRDTLREELGQTYSVSVGRASYLPLSEYGTVSITFGSAPANVDGLVAAVFREIDRFKRDGPTTVELKAYQERGRRSLETSVKQNGYWLGALLTALSLGHDPLTILDRGRRLESLTPDAVRDAARSAFPGDRHTIVSLVPETAAK